MSEKKKRKVCKRIWENSTSIERLFCLTSVSPTERGAFRQHDFSFWPRHVSESKNKTVNSGSRPNGSAGHGWYLWKLLEPPLKICGFEQVLAARLAFNDGGSGGFEAGRGNTRDALRRPERVIHGVRQQLTVDH